MFLLYFWTLMWYVSFVLNRRTQRGHGEKMDSTESPQHQAPAHVSHGQWRCIFRSHAASLVRSDFDSRSIFFESEMASVNAVQQHAWGKERQNKPAATAGGESKRKNNNGLNTSEVQEEKDVKNFFFFRWWWCCILYTFSGRPLTELPQ